MSKELKFDIYTIGLFSKKKEPHFVFILSFLKFTFPTCLVVNDYRMYNFTSLLLILVLSLFPDFHDSNEYNEESPCSMPDEIDIKEEVFIQEEIPSPGSYG